MQLSDEQKAEYLQDLALVMAVTCVRNTVIEDYHSAGKLSDPEMTAFNKEVADNLYTFMHYFLKFDPCDERRKEFFDNAYRNYPFTWNKPELKE